MPIFMPEKMVITLLIFGLEAIKGNPDLYLPDILDTDILGSSAISKVKTYLAGNEIKVRQGYPMEDTKTATLFVSPSSIQMADSVVGDFLTTRVETITDEEGEETDYGIDTEGVLNHHSVRIITASMNSDVTLFLDAIARYILYTGKSTLLEHGFVEASISSSEFDPIYRYLPQHLSYKTTTVAGKAFDTWENRDPIAIGVEINASFDPV